MKKNNWIKNTIWFWTVGRKSTGKWGDYSISKWFSLYRDFMDECKNGKSPYGN